MPKPYIFALTALLSIISSSAFAESITLSTYYPAPYGIYKQFKTTSNTHLATDSGSVGIGTVSPNYKLDVTGDINFTGDLYQNGSAFSGGIPSGAIMLFDASCPNGWTRFSDLDGRVPRGASTYGGTTGATETHTHSGPSHTHSMSHVHHYDCTNCHGGLWTKDLGNTDPTTTGAAGTGSTGSASSWPPYLNVIWCKKN